MSDTRGVDSPDPDACRVFTAGGPLSDTRGVDSPDPDACRPPTTGGRFDDTVRGVSQVQRRVATTAPTAAHPTMRARWLQANPAPAVNGLKASASALANAFSGNTPPTIDSASGMSSPTTKTSDTKARGTSVPLVIAWVAAEVRAMEDTANPSAAKQPIPTTSASTAAGSLPQTICTSRNTTPATTMRTTAAVPDTTPAPTRPPSSAAVGMGSAR